MSILQWMTILGLPSLFTIMCFVVGWLRSQGKKINILMKAIQSQMRSELLSDYYRFKNAGYISSDDLDDWENRYQAYHSLGKNGVLDKRRDELFSLKSNLDDGGC